MAIKKIDEETKRKVVAAHTRGLSMKKIAEEFGISPSSVSKIIKDKGKQPAQKRSARDKLKTERQKRIEDIERRLAELERKILAREARKW